MSYHIMLPSLHFVNTFPRGSRRPHVADEQRDICSPLALKLKTYLHFSMSSDFGEKFLANSTFLGEHFLVTTRITPRPRHLAYRFSGSSLCISGLHSTARRVGISVRSLRAESGERCGTESRSSPSPVGMCRVNPLQSPPSCALCQAFV